jgi:hypothetical protein
MQLPSGASTWPQAEAVGRYFLSLVDEPDWLLRRVETMEFLDSNRAQRRISIDIDVDKLKAVANQHGLPFSNRLYVPLTLLAKNLLIDFDVTGQNSESLSVVTSDQDSHAAFSLLLALAAESGFNPTSFSVGMLQKLYKIVSDIPSSTEINAIENAQALAGSSITIDSWQLEQGITASATDLITWENLFRVERFLRYIMTFTAKYMPIVAIDTNNTGSIVKFRIVDLERSFLGSDVTFRERLAIDQQLIAVDAPSIGRAQREHLRIVAPGGTFVTSAIVRSVASNASTGTALAPSRAQDSYHRRLTTTRAVIYTRRTATGPHHVVLALRPKLSGFSTPSMLSVVLIILLLGLGSIGQMTAGIIDDVKANTSDAAVALLLLIPSAFSAYLAREGEHEIRATLLRTPRYAVGATSLLALIGAISITAGFSGHVVAIVWAISAALCVPVLALLVIISLKVRETYTTVVKNSNSSERRRILYY